MQLNRYTVKRFSGISSQTYELAGKTKQQNAERFDKKESESFIIAFHLHVENLQSQFFTVFNAVPFFFA